MEETNVSQLVSGQRTGQQPTGTPCLICNGGGLERLAADNLPGISSCWPYGHTECHTLSQRFPGGLAETWYPAQVFVLPMNKVNLFPSWKQGLKGMCEQARERLENSHGDVQWTSLGDSALNATCHCISWVSFLLFLHLLARNMAGDIVLHLGMCWQGLPAKAKSKVLPCSSCSLPLICCHWSSWGP